jgi:class 3 adenylate cyclase
MHAHDGTVRYHDTLLTLANGLFLVAAFYETNRKRDDSSPPPHASGTILVTSFYILIAISLAGVLSNVCNIFSSCFRTKDKTKVMKSELLLSPWLSSHIYVILYTANEFIFKVLIMSNFATVWELPNASGRTRLVYPMRYVSWASTNSYIFTAVAVSLGLRPGETFSACLGIVVCTLASFPLELNPVASPTWLFSAIVSSFALFTCLTLITSRAVELFPLADRFEATALAVILFTSCLTYLTFPLIFFAAVLCGGDGQGSCLTNAEEANAWFIIEGLAKLLFCLLIVAASSVSASCVAAYNQSSSMLVPHAVRIHNLPSKFKTVGKEQLTWTEVLAANIGVLVGAPAFTGYFVFVVQDTIFSSPSFKFASDDILEAVESIKRASGAITVLAAASVFFVALDSVLKREKLKILVRTLMPAVYRNGEAESDWALGSTPFAAPAILYIEEPHVSVLVCNIVDFSPASLDTVPTEIMTTLGSLFRHFDQLHTAAGVVKVETTGDTYQSVMGASSSSTPGAIIPDAVTQAATMASLALSLIEAAREHKWPNGAPVVVRIGLHCGQATSGLLGGLLPRWGLFGRTVVIASHLESSGKPSCVHVSTAFAAALRGDAGAHAFALTEHEVNVKGIGLMHTFLLLRGVDTFLLRSEIGHQKIRTD